MQRIFDCLAYCAMVSQASLLLKLLPLLQQSLVREGNAVDALQRVIFNLIHQMDKKTLVKNLN